MVPADLLTCSRTMRGALSSRERDRRRAHVPSTRVPQHPRCLCKAFVSQLVNTAKAEELDKEMHAGHGDEDEVDHDMET